MRALEEGLPLQLTGLSNVGGDAALELDALDALEDVAGFDDDAADLDAAFDALDDFLPTGERERERERERQRETTGRVAQGSERVLHERVVGCAAVCLVSIPRHLDGCSSQPRVEVEPISSLCYLPRGEGLSTAECGTHATQTGNPQGGHRT